MDTKLKMVFRLEKDEDGYPPDDFETMWVEKVAENQFRIDNIPFYVNDISPDDLVSGSTEGGNFFFDRIISKSKISVTRVVVFADTVVDEVLKSLVDMGCRWEGSHLKSLYAIEIPAHADADAVRSMLDKYASDDALDYEESSVRA